MSAPPLPTSRVPPRSFRELATGALISVTDGLEGMILLHRPIGDGPEASTEQISKRRLQDDFTEVV